MALEVCFLSLSKLFLKGMANKVFMCLWWRGKLRRCASITVPLDGGLPPDRFSLLGLRATLAFRTRCALLTVSPLVVLNLATRRPALKAVLQLLYAQLLLRE